MKTIGKFKEIMPMLETMAGINRRIGDCEITAREFQIYIDNRPVEERPWYINNFVIYRRKDENDKWGYVYELNIRYDHLCERYDLKEFFQDEPKVEIENE